MSRIITSSGKRIWYKWYITPYLTLTIFSLANLKYGSKSDKYLLSGLYLSCSLYSKES